MDSVPNDSDIPSTADNSGNTAQKDEKHAELKKGIEVITRAVELDRCHNYSEAYRFYTDGLRKMKDAIKPEDRTPNVIKKYKQYLDRAVKIKKFLLRNEERQKEDGHIKQMLVEIVNDVREVHLDDVVGLQNAKDTLKERIVLPSKFPALFKGASSRSFCGFCLIFGSPGTGKTLLAEAVARESGVYCLHLNVTKLMSKQSEAEQFVKAVFNQARDYKPSLIFVDEFDKICFRENVYEYARRIKQEFMVQLMGEGFDNKDVHVFAATNKPWKVDDVFIRRNFRYSNRLIYVPLPDKPDRCRMVEVFLKDLEINHSLTDTDLDEIGNRADGFSGSDIRNLVGEVEKQLYILTKESRWFVKVPAKPKTEPQLSQVDTCSNVDTEHCDTFTNLDCTFTQDHSSLDQENSGSGESNLCQAVAAMTFEGHLDTEESSASYTCTHSMSAFATKSNDGTYYSGARPASLQSTSETTMSENPTSIEYYRPCSPDTVGAIGMDSSTIPWEQLVLPPVSLEQFLLCLKDMKPTVTKENIEEQLEFKKEFVDSD